MGSLLRLVAWLSAEWQRSGEDLARLQAALLEKDRREARMRRAQEVL